MTRYFVYFTPLVGDDTYGDEVDVSDYVEFKGIGAVKRSLDSNDYDVGAYVYNDLDIKVVNQNGLFNDETDGRSMFTFSRDLTKVRIVFENDDGQTITFRGIISDEASKLDTKTERVTFRVLSKDSIIRTSQVSGGSISNGTNVRNAFFSILNIPRITSVLNVDIANINPDLNFVIDAGNEFDDKPVKEAVAQLLFASNSVMVVDSSDNVIIRSRDEDESTDVLNLYGPFDLKRRQNVVNLFDYNSGKHRTFTSVLVNDTERSLNAYVAAFGFRQKQAEMPFVTDATTEADIANRIMNEFKVPKIECAVEVPTYVSRNVNLLDRVSLSWPLRIKPAGAFFPIIGVTKIGDTDSPLPYAFGSIEITANVKFKVIEIKEDPNKFTTELKLRQAGKDIGDGYFNEPGACGIIGFAVIGAATVCDGGTACDAYEVSSVGAAQIGCTLVA